jgi:hypothetical protein
MSCGSGNPLGNLISTLFDLIFGGDPIGTILKTIANAVLKGAIALLGEITNGIATLTGTNTSKAISGQVQWLVVYLAVGSLIAASIRMATERRAEAGITAMKGLLRLILVATLATTVATSAAVVADNFSRYLFATAVESNLKDMVCVSGSDSIDALLLLVLAILLIFTAILHIILLYIRLGVTIVLLGTMPLAAAASMLNWGQGWWRKHLAWMVAWLAYKPAVALIIYSGTKMLADGSAGNAADAVHLRIAGVAVLAMSAVALPALLKLIVPAVATLGGGSMSSGVKAAGGGLATGAKQMAAGGLSAVSASIGKAGPSGARGSNGPSGRNGSAGSRGSAGSAARAASAAGGPASIVAGAALQAAGSAAKGAAKGAATTATGALDDAGGDGNH